MSPPVSRVPFERLAELYEKDVAARSDKPRGAKSVRDARNAFLRVVAGLRTRRLTRNDLGKVREVLLAEGRSRATINCYLRQARAIINFAVREKMIADPELRFRDFMLKETKPDKYISPAQVEDVLEAAKRIDPRLYPFYRFQYDAGARLQELLHLRWGAIDLNTGKVRIVNNDEWSTKTRESRSFYLAPETLEWLKEYRDSLEFNGEEYPVFQMLPGKPWTEHFYKVQRKIFGAVGREVCRGMSHALRHASISDMFESRVPLNVIMAHHGHRQVSTTMRYAHAQEEALKAAAAEMAKRRKR